jgi:xanthine dehydrogenase accessory factor
MKSLENLITDFISFRESGQGAALVTIIGNTGSSPRPLGSQMVVSEDGRSVGYLTGGCAEAVIVSEAVAAIKSQRNREMRLGVGSPYMDILLPCGAGIDLYIDVGLGIETARQIETYLSSRAPVALDTCCETGKHQTVINQSQSVNNGAFRRWYLPRRRLLILGKGPNTAALASLGKATDYEVKVFSPDRDTRRACAGEGVEASVLTSPEIAGSIPVDAWTASVLLFHEHDWESAILKTLLKTDCFYIGALGSRRTHEQRIRQLQSLGLDKAVHRIHGPVGMDIRAVTPIEIAVSILAEVTLAYRSCNLLQPTTATLLFSDGFVCHSGESSLQ